MELYPLFFHPLHIKKVWGGQKLARLYNRNLPADKIGESWEITDRPEANSIVRNGPLKNQSISQLMSEYGEQIIGSRINEQNSCDSLPLLFKILTPEDRLSVQVHPDEKFAESCQEAYSKKEMWYVLEAEPGAKIIYGLKDRNISPERVVKAAEHGQLEELLYYRKISTGEAIFIAPGMIHALLGGSVIAEIQQNSDTTYRIYDWNRKDSLEKARPLHLEKAQKNMRTDFHPGQSYYYPKFYKNNMWRLLSICRSFTAYEVHIKNKEVLHPQKLNSLIIIFCYRGKIQINHQKDNYQLNKGESCLLPANLTRLEVTGRAKLLLYHRGYSPKEFRSLIKEKKLPAQKIVRIPGVAYEYL